MKGSDIALVFLFLILARVILGEYTDLDKPDYSKNIQQVRRN